jgi:hypothetical protein
MKVHVGHRSIYIIVYSQYCVLSFDAVLCCMCYCISAGNLFDSEFDGAREEGVLIC